MRSGEVCGDFVGEAGEGAQVVASLDDAAQVLEAEESVGVTGWGCAVIKAAKRKPVEVPADVERRECGADRREIKVAQGDVIRVEAPDLVVRDESHALASTSERSSSKVIAASRV